MPKCEPFDSDLVHLRECMYAQITAGVSHASIQKTWSQIESILSRQAYEREIAENALTEDSYTLASELKGYAESFHKFAIEDGRNDLALVEDCLRRARNKIVVLTEDQKEKDEIQKKTLKALKWALPLAKIAMESYRYDRIKNGHNSDITGTYRNGETWVGIWQAEVDQIEEADDALKAAQDR